MKLIRQAEQVQVRFYTQSGLDSIETNKNGDKGEGPSRLPDAKKDNVGLSIKVLSY